jgi:hypothetical protein
MTCAQCVDSLDQIINFVLVILNPNLISESENYTRAGGLACIFLIFRFEERLHLFEFLVLHHIMCDVDRQGLLEFKVETENLKRLHSVIDCHFIQGAEASDAEPGVV